MSEKEITILEVIIKGRGEKEAKGQAVIWHWSRQARIKRALKFLLLFLGLSIVSVILPIVHFILVPGFFLTAIIGAWVISQQKSIVHEGIGICPYCEKTLVITKGADKWPLSEVCIQCKDHVLIEKAP